MTLEEAMDDASTVTAKQAEAEFRAHHVEPGEWQEFQACYGVRATYRSCDVLGWLGW